MTRVRVDGVDYSNEGVMGVRAEVIELRDAALKAERFDWTVVLSHAIAYLAEYAELLDEAENQKTGQPPYHGMATPTQSGAVQRND